MMLPIPQLLQQVKELIDNKLYQQVIDLLPDSILTQYNDAILYFKSGIAKEQVQDHQSAIRDYTRAINLNPDYADYYNARGTAMSFTREVERAIRDYSKAIELNPEFAIAYFNRGEAFKGLSKYDDAIADYKKAIKIKPDFDIAYVSRGFTRYLEGDTDKAIEDYNRAIKLNPNNAFAWYYRANALVEKKIYGKAIEDFNRAILLKPDFADAYYSRARAWEEKKEYDKAIADHSKAIELNPEHADAYCERGDLLYKKKEREKAIEDFTKLIELWPYETIGYNWRGSALWDLGEYDKAIEDFTIVIGLNPTGPIEWLTRANIKGARLEAQKKASKADIEDAIRDYDEAIKLDPGLSKAYCERGVLLSIIKEYNRAIKDLEKAVLLDPGDNKAWHWIGVTKSEQDESEGPKNDEDRQAIRERAAAFVELISTKLSIKFKNSKEGFLHGWNIEEWDQKNKRPLVAGIQGWLPEIMPEIAKWKKGEVEGEKGIYVYTHDNEIFWPSLVGIPIKKDLWRAITIRGRQYRIAEKIHHQDIKTFSIINLTLERIITNIRTGHLDHELAFGNYVLPTVMEDFNDTLRRMLEIPYEPKKKKKS